MRTQIIIGARHKHLISTLRSETTALSQALIDQVVDAWISYVQSKVGKGLPATDLPPAGSERAQWPKLVERFQDKEWRLQGLQKDEKFEMHYKAAVSYCFPQNSLVRTLCFLHNLHGHP